MSSINGIRGEDDNSSYLSESSKEDSVWDLANVNKMAMVRDHTTGSQHNIKLSTLLNRLQVQAQEGGMDQDGQHIRVVDRSVKLDKKSLFNSAMVQRNKLKAFAVQPEEDGADFDLGGTNEFEEDLDLKISNYNKKKHLASKVL